MEQKIKQTSLALGWLICSMGMIFYFYEFLLRIAPSVMEMEIREFFNISAASFGTLVGLFYFAYTPMQLLVGVIVDLYGVRKILTLATLLCAFGTYIFGTTHSIWFAGSGRFLIGLGSSFAFVAALKLASLWLPADRFATFTGVVSALGMLGGIVGDLGITGLVGRFGWQQVMIFGGMAGIVLAILIALIVRDQNHHVVKRINAQEMSKEYLKIIRNRQIWLSGLIACMLYLALSACAEIWGIPYLKAAFGFSPHQAAFANAMIFLGWLVGGPLSGWISDRIRKRRLPIIIGSIVGFLSISAVLYLPNLSYSAVALLLLIFGLGTSTELICFAVGYESAPKEVGGTAIAFVNLLTMFGGFVFQPAIGKFLDLAWSGSMHNSIRSYTAQDYRLALSALPIAMIISLILAIIMRESFKETKTILPHE